MAENIQGMAELRRKLKAIAQKGARKAELDVGFFAGKSYENGPPIASVAALNEFGAAINVPERTTTVYRSLRSDGVTYNRQGRFVKKRVANVATDHVVPAHTIIIPARPFMRTTISENQMKWYAAFAKILRDSNLDSKTSLTTLGEQIVNDIQATIRGWTEPPNAPSTIRKKKRNNPLEDTNQMINNVTFRVKI